MQLYSDSLKRGLYDNGDRSGVVEPPPGVSFVGMHQPFPKKRLGGDRKCVNNQQSRAATGRDQVSLPQHKVPGPISSEPEWLFGLLLHSVNHRVISRCSCGQLTHLPFHSADWQTAWRRVWWQTSGLGNVSHHGRHHSLCCKLHQ